MTMDTTAVVVDALLEVAPDLDRATLDPDALRREDLELESMDSMNIVVVLNEATCVDIPEQDYGELTTVAAIAQHLDTRVASGGAIVP
jgi:acyl carrier protein